MLLHFRRWLSRLTSSRFQKKSPWRRTVLRLALLEDRTQPSTTLGATALLEGPASGSGSDRVSTSGAWVATANNTWLHLPAGDFTPAPFHRK